MPTERSPGPSGTVARIALLLLQLGGANVEAQGIGSTTGSLFGLVEDSSETPLAGVAVTASGSGGPRATVTDEEGRFQFPFLVPGEYEVRLTLAGWRPVEQRGVRIQVNERIVLALSMQPELDDAIEVTGEAPLIDLGSTTIGANLPRAMISGLPVGRTFTAVVQLAPGVGDSGVGGNPSISGGSGLENSYLIDGVNVTDPGYGSSGAYSIKFGAQASGFPPDMLEEVKVMTGGFEPEYGQALGGVVTVVTRSGGNRFLGSTFAYWAPDALAQEPGQVDLDEVYVVNRAGEESLDGGFQLGGPIVRDRLFFFVAYDRKREEPTFANDPEAPLAEEYPSAANVRTTDAYVAKLSARFGSSQTLELSVFGDPASSDLGNQNGFGIQSLDPEGKQSALEYGGDHQVLRWNGALGSRFFAEAQAARSANDFEELPGPAADGPFVIDRTVRPAVFSGGFGEYDSGSESTNDHWGFKATVLRRNHEVRFGAQLEEVGYAGGSRYTGDGFLLSDGRTTSSGARVTIRPGSLYGLPVDKVYTGYGSLAPTRWATTTVYRSAFLQDSWSVTPRLNLRLGVRWEEQRIQGEIAGSEDVTFPDNWAPRLGLTWDYRGNGASKAFFHYGRFFEKIPNALAVYALSPHNFVSRRFYDLELTRPIPGQEVIQDLPPVEVEGLGRSTSPFTARSPYVDEWVAGVEQEVGRAFTLGARLVYRRVGRVLEDIGLNLGVPCLPGYLGTESCVPPGVTAEEWPDVPTGYLITNLDGHYPGFPKLERDYRAFELTAQKRYANGWQLLASYRYSRLEGNYEGLFQREIEQSIPNLGLVADFADSPWLAFTYAPGPLPNDVQHTAKLFATYDWKFGFQSGLAFNYASGRPLTELGAVPFFGSQARVLTPRGDFGRGDEIVTLDLHAAYEFALGGGSTIAVGVDLFNLFDARAATEVVSNSEINNDTFEPEPNSDFLKPAAYQSPRSTRFFVRYSF